LVAHTCPTANKQDAVADVQAALADYARRRGRPL